MSIVHDKKRKIDEIIKVENENEAPAAKKMKQAEENNNDDSVIITDEVIIKKEIKIESNSSKTDENQENDNQQNDAQVVNNQENDHDVLICSVVENKNNSNQSIDLAKADDMNCSVKFCPNCKVQVNRTQKDIIQRCSIMTCTNCSEWTYWCWDCNTVVDMERQDMRCLNCRKISRKRRNSKNKNINVKKEKEELDESNEANESQESKESQSKEKNESNESNEESSQHEIDKTKEKKTFTDEERQLLIEITEKDLAQSEQLKTEALNNFIANDMAIAENKYLNALKFNPNDPIIYFKLSEIFLATSSYYKALISAYKAIKFDPSHKEAWIVYGKAWMKLKNFKFARIAFDTAATLENQNENNENKENDNEIEYDEEYIACKSELDTFANNFKDTYMNSVEEKTQQLLSSILDNNENLRNLYFKHKGMSEELMDKLNEFSEVKQFMTGELIFELVMQSKYKSLEYINELEQIRNCWNLTVEPQGIYKAFDKNMSNSVNTNPMEIDTDKCLFDFEKMVFQMQLCNSTSGTVVWVNKGHHGYNESVWCDMQPHIIFGKPTAMQVVDMIKRTILYHRKGMRGKCELTRPLNIVLTPRLTDENEFIKAELKKMHIGCCLAGEECPLSIHLGGFDGHVMLC